MGWKGLAVAGTLGAALLTRAMAASDGVLWIKPGHGGGARASAISSRHIATGGDDGGIHLWDANSRAFLRSLPGHTRTIRHLAFSSDGTSLASASADGSVRIHDLNGGTSATLFDTPAYVQAGIAFQSQSNRLVTLASNGEFSFWNIADRSLAGSHALGRSASTFALSPDGEMIAAATGTDIQVIDLADGTSAALLGHTDVVRSLAFSPDGSTLISAGGSADGAGSDTKVRLWSTATGGLIETIGAHTAGIRAVAFAPNPNVILSVGFDQQLVAWDLTIDRPVFTRNIANFETLAVSPDANFIIAGNEIIDTRTYEFAEFVSHLQPVQSLAFSADGSILVSDDNLAPRVWSAQTGALVHHWNFTGNTRSPSVSVGPIARVALPISFAPNNATILAQDRLWARASGEEISRLAISANAIAPTWQTFLTFSYGEEVAALRPFPEGLEIRALVSPQSRRATAAAFSRDGTLIATAGGAATDGSAIATVKIWSAGSGQLIKQFPNSQARPTLVAFSPDQRFVASSSEQNGAEVTVWEIASGRVVLSLRKPGAPASSFAFSPTSAAVAWGHSDGVELWNLHSGSQTAHLTNELRNLSALTISADGTTLAAGRMDGTILAMRLPSPAIEIDASFAGTATLLLPTTIGANYTVEHTANFTNWSSADTFTATSAQTQITVPTATGHRFFRLRQN